MSDARILILDYGMGNLRSVEKALEHVGARATIGADPEAVRAADGLILPGVGAFPRAMERIRATGLDQLIAERAAAGTPILGICLGLQLLFERSEELGAADGLGLLPGAVTRLDAPGLKVPNIGWAPVRWERESRLATGIDTGTPFYLVHSFVARPTAEDTLGTAEYGERFACAAERGNVFGVQFHPEKSSAAGLRLLANFAGICAEGPGGGVILYPAIDIRDGHAVRLVEGDYDRETIFDADPVDAALRFAGAGVHILHVVDLDGAKAGEPVNLKTIRRIADAVPFPIQVGGGLRNADCVANVLRAGAEHVVIGTAAMRDPEFLDAMLKAHDERIIVSVDARADKVSLAGWTETSDVDVADAVTDLVARGVQRFLFTPIEVDGTLSGPGFEQLARVAVAAASASVIYSGGVGTIADLERLRAEAAPNVDGVIVGRALYEKRFTVEEAVAALA